jgi:predicted TIM-barrel fold metal-dependent hydrolase
VVIDTHTHAWGPPSDDHPWVNGPLIDDHVEDFAVETIYTADRLQRDLLAADARIDEAIVVGYPICDWRDNWYTRRCASEYDSLYGIGMLDPFAEDAADRLRDLMSTEGMLGVRLGAGCPSDAMWERFDPGVEWLRESIEESDFWDVARETEAAIQILAVDEQLDQVSELVEAYPDVTYLLDHFAYTDPATAPGQGEFAKMEALAVNDSVAVKISEAPHVSEESFPYGDLHDHVRWLVETFGRERVLWGSDFPNVSDTATYDETYDWLEHVETLSSADRSWLTERAARSHLDL